MLYRQYWVYIIGNYENGTLYVGVTDNLKRRIYEHKNKIVQGFSSKYGLNKLFYFEEYNDIREAIKKEKQIKNWRRQWKIDLIEKENPNWKDLSKLFE